MRSKNDYFLLYHGLCHERKELPDIKHTEDTLFFEVSALILSTTRKELNKFNVLDSFKRLVLEITDRPCNTLDDLYPLQASLINYIERGKKAILERNRNHEEIIYIRLLLMQKRNIKISMLKKLNILEKIKLCAMTR